MLKLRRGVVVAADPLEVEVELDAAAPTPDTGVRRRAWADPTLVGPCQVGDEVIVNVAALDLDLGSGGFDLVHVNLSRGLEGGGSADGVHVMKLNYTSLQHPVEPIEAPVTSPVRPERTIPVLILPLHGHLAPAAWAVRAAGGEGPIGYIQTPGAALAGSLSRDVPALLERGLLDEHVTVAPCFGGAREAISTVGALHAGAEELDWSAAIAGPGPGILGSDSRYGHGGMGALDSAHAALALGLPTVLSPRMSESDPRPRHRGLSHHTRSVLELLLASVTVAAPEDADASGLAPFADRHCVKDARADLEGYAAAGLSRRTMGRDLDEDRLFYAAPLAAGSVLAEAMR